MVKSPPREIRQRGRSRTGSDAVIAQIEYASPSISVTETIELLWLWTWYWGCGLALLARLSASTPLCCSLCGGERRVPARLFPPNTSNIPFYCSYCSGNISGRRGVKFLDSLRRTAAASKLLLGNESELFAALQFQSYQFKGLPRFKVRRAYSFEISNDYDTRQESAAEISSDTVYSAHLRRDTLQAKIQMDKTRKGSSVPADCADLDWDDFANASKLAHGRASHLEIGNVLQNHPEIETAIPHHPKRVDVVSVESPNMFTKPPNKCWHGCWEISACRICTPSPIDDHRDESYWDERVSVFSTVNACDLCGHKIANWRQHYCQECAQHLMWQIEFPVRVEQPNVDGSAARYQTKQVRQSRSAAIPAVQFGEVKIYVQTLIDSVVPGLCVADDAVGLWLIHNVPWVHKILTRFWFFLHGCTLAQIAELEDVQPHAIHKYLMEHASNIRRLFCQLGTEKT
jgi:hypothetical protein